MMQAKKKLEKMKMPAKRGKEEEMEMSLAELDMPAELEGEEMASEGAEMEMEDSPASSMLESASDDELLAELKKRGLESKLSSEKPEMEMEEDESQEMYS
jgi:hypothetical protein